MIQPSQEDLKTLHEIGQLQPSELLLHPGTCKPRKQQQSEIDGNVYLYGSTSTNKLL
jgi:hypothetical protein